jgi:predicted Kef-type K+ transport protein
MDFEWVAIALGDVSWIALSFALGFLAKQLRLPPLVGFLAAGFILGGMGFSGGEVLEKLADLGITLLLFTVGLKMNPAILVKPHVWAVTGLHMAISTLVFASLILLLAAIDAPLFSGLERFHALILGFALSFSSTVFAVKSLQERGLMATLFGSVSIGILVMQDLAAVIFLAVSSGKFPLLWSLLLFLLLPLRPPLHRLLDTSGHGELLILYGLVLALGGAELFELVGIKGDLGALIMGVLISTHPKASEMAKSMLGFKDLFLLGFFLSIGMSGQLSLEAFIVGLLLVPLVLAKSALFYALLTGFKLRARTALMSTMALSNYSEFGLIVTAIAVSAGWLSSEWLVVLSIALTFSFIVASWLNGNGTQIYTRFRPTWLRFQREERLPDDELLDISNASIAIFGMGRVGSGAYDKIQALYGDKVIGIDASAKVVAAHQHKGRRVLHGDAGDPEFWDKILHHNSLDLVMLALPQSASSLNALKQLREAGFRGQVATTAAYGEDEAALRKAGANTVFNIYSEAGTGFASHVSDILRL